MSVGSSAFAEYYIVTSSAPCGYGCFEPYHAKKKKTHKKYVKKKTHKVKKYVRKRRYYEYECRSPAYYVWQPTTVCGCGYWTAVECDCGRRYQPPRRDYYKDPTFTTPSDNAYYDPDLATGDDDAMRYPGMDIDR